MTEQEQAALDWWEDARVHSAKWREEHWNNSHATIVAAMAKCTDEMENERDEALRRAEEAERLHNVWRHERDQMAAERDAALAVMHKREQEVVTARRERDDALTQLAEARRKLAEAGVEGSPPPGEDTTIGALRTRAQNAEECARALYYWAQLYCRAQWQASEVLPGAPLLATNVTNVRTFRPPLRQEVES